MDLDKGLWKGKKVLVTGHTGFKGTWLSLILSRLGAEVYGISLSPDKNTRLYSEARIYELMAGEFFLDIRDYQKIQLTISNLNPEYIFHLAAQSLVRKSVRDPLETFSTNAIGSANLILASILNPSLLGITVATTDKVYENFVGSPPFKETDKLGGQEPYSSSKAAAELIISALRTSNNPRNIPITTVRAGNVIGGGDWGEERLFPDLVKAAITKQEIKIRSPKATRPWQHVLDCLTGYLLVAEMQMKNPLKTPLSINFGPASSLSVENLIELFEIEFNCKLNKTFVKSKIKEHEHLRLNSEYAHQSLGWGNIYNSRTAISLTANWYARFNRGEDAMGLMLQDLNKYWEMNVDL